MRKKFITYLGVAGIWLGSMSTVSGTLLEAYASPLQQPAQIMAPFGQVRSGYTHQGIDVVAPMYTPLYAAKGGVVTKAAPDSKGVNKGGGHMIFIDHQDGTASWYMHLSVYGVAEGDYVEAGQWIGLSGDTGNVTGPHLHFEYRIEGVPVDPFFLFEMPTEEVLDEEQKSVEIFQASFQVEQQ